MKENKINIRFEIYCLCAIILLPLISLAQIKTLKDSLINSGVIDMSTVNELGKNKIYTFDYKIDDNNIFCFSIDQNCKLYEIGFVFKTSSTYSGSVYHNYIRPENRVIFFIGGKDSSVEANCLQHLLIILNKKKKVMYVAEFKNGIKTKEIYKDKSFKRNVDLKYGFQISGRNKFWGRESGFMRKFGRN